MPLEFCELCKSIKTKGNCSNKNCKNHLKELEPPSFKQVNYIREMLEKLKLPENYNFREMTVKDASEVIKELEGKLELGE